jgi:peptide/nickel transport system permease protein
MLEAKADARIRLVRQRARQVSGQSPLRLSIRRFLRHRFALGGACAGIALVALTLLAPVVSGRDPLLIDVLQRFLPPLVGGHALGTDELGRDVLSRLLYAGRISLTIGFVAMTVTIVAGSLVGAIAAYYGRGVDLALMHLTDVLLCFPTVFLLLTLASFVRPTVLSIALIVGLTSWMEVARVVRGQLLSLREQDFVTAARALGCGDPRIIVRHLLPNGLAPILVAATLNVANAILMESYISYLGYGIQPPVASWGNMLNNAQSYLSSAPWIAVFPGVAITLAVMSFNFIGDGLRDALDPRMRPRAAGGEYA